MTYIIQNHSNLVFDPMLNFPVGGVNPREPLFDWMNAILGIVLAPFFGGNAIQAGAWVLDLQAPLWAALGVFPVYLIGREVANKRTGLIAAMIFPFLSANIDSSIFGYANYLSFYTFLVLVLLVRTGTSAPSRRSGTDATGGGLPPPSTVSPRAPSLRRATGTLGGEMGGLHRRPPSGPWRSPGRGTRTAWWSSTVPS